MRGPGAGRPRQAGSLGRGLPEAGPQASGGPLSRASPPQTVLRHRARLEVVLLQAVSALPTEGAEQSPGPA